MKFKKIINRKSIQYILLILLFLIIVSLALNTKDAKKLIETLKSNTNLSNIKDDNNTDTPNPSSDIVNPADFQEAYVKRAVDGDTLVVIINNKEYKVRFIGVNTPESTTKIEKYGKEASNYTKTNLVGKVIYLQKDVSQTDKYGRLLRYIWLKIPNTINEQVIRENMYNANLLLNGYANTMTYPPDVKYSNLFINFEKEAREKSLGLWNL
ncbi:MAG: thermonuclease family protein [Clostridia bacterium]